MPYYIRDLERDSSLENYPVVNPYHQNSPTALYILGSMGPKALKYESFEGKGEVPTQAPGSIVLS